MERPRTRTERLRVTTHPPATRCPFSSQRHVQEHHTAKSFKSCFSCCQEKQRGAGVSYFHSRLFMQVQELSVRPLRENFGVVRSLQGPLSLGSRES